MSTNDIINLVHSLILVAATPAEKDVMLKNIQQSVAVRNLLPTLAKAQMELDRLLPNYDRMSYERDQAKAALDALTSGADGIDSLRKANAALKKEVESLGALLSTEQEKKAALLEEVASHVKNNTKSTDYIARLQGKVVDLDSQLTAAKKKVTTLTDVNADLAKLIEENEKKLKDLTAVVSSRYEEIADLKKKTAANMMESNVVVSPMQQNDRLVQVLATNATLVNQVTMLEAKLKGYEDADKKLAESLNGVE